MKHYIYIITCILLTSCNPFHEDRVLDYESEFKEICEAMDEYGNVVLYSDKDKKLGDDMRKLRIDIIVKNNYRHNSIYSSFEEGNDSIIMFIQKSYSIAKPNRRIFYDFAETPRHFGNDTIPTAAYERIQLNDRWYYSTVGFD